MSQDAYAAGEPHPSAYDAAKILVTAARHDPATPWLKDVPTSVLSNAVQQAATAYDNFFASLSGRRSGPRMGSPSFHRKQSRQAITFARTNFGIKGHWGNTNRGGGRLRITRIGKVHVNWHRPLPGPPSSVTIIRETDGRWFASFVVPVINTPSWPTREQRSAGVDVGLTDYAAIIYTDGTREKIANPRYLRRAERKLVRSQKNLSRKQKGSRNREKARTALARAHSKIANQRSNHARQLATRLTRENQTVAVETLNIAGLARTRLGKSVHDAGWAQFIRFLEEAGHKRGNDILKAPARYPSSRVCSNCGVNSGKKPLHIRDWVCPHCGVHLDRDYNAAVNILVAAGPAETRNACGGDVGRELARAVTREAGTHLKHAPTGRARRKPRRRSATTVEASSDHRPTQPVALNPSRGLTRKAQGIAPPDLPNRPQNSGSI